MLENLNNFKGAEFKQGIFEMLQVCMKNYSDQLRNKLRPNCDKIINMLHNQDNLAKPLAEFVGLVTLRQDIHLANEIIKQVMRQIKSN